MSDLRKYAAPALLLAAMAVMATMAAIPSWAAAAPVAPEIVELHSDASPLVSIRLLFNAGSIYDPPGKEGLAALTGLMIAESGTQQRSYSDLLEALFPMAASIGLNTDREVTVINGTVHRDQLDAYTALLEEALLRPAFAESDFQRNKEQLLSYLTNTLRTGSDELLGLEALQDKIFAGHPYGHPPQGSVESLQRITLDDVKAFYKQRYTQGGLMLGLAGGYPKGYVDRLKKDLAALPAGQKGRMELPPPPKVSGRNLQLIDKETASVAVNFGMPLPINRSNPDYFPLMVANSYLGEHRTFYGKLMTELRGNRGLNYGDYSYIEYWLAPPFTDYPAPNVPRRQQYFSVWIRPVVPADAQFALRAGLYQVQKLHDEGMTKADFEATRNLLINYSKLWAQSLDLRLGFLMDSRFYGMPPYFDEIESRLKSMTVEQVNAAVRKYLDPSSLAVVVVTNDAQKLADTLKKDEASPKTYNSQAAPAVLEADKTIQSLKVQPAKIDIVPIAQVFQK